MPVDTFDVVLNSTTTMMFSMILLLILGFDLFACDRNYTAMHTHVQWSVHLSALLIT
jgi:hypothetical protein